MHGKPLSALLQILRAAGVTSYETKDLKLTLGPPPPPKHRPTALNVSPEALAEDEEAEKGDDDEPHDWRFALERQERHFPRPRANPRKNKAREDVA